MKLWSRDVHCVCGCNDMHCDTNLLIFIGEITHVLISVVRFVSTRCHCFGLLDQNSGKFCLLCGITVAFAGGSDFEKFQRFQRFSIHPKVPLSSIQVRTRPIAFCRDDPRSIGIEANHNV